MFPHWRFADPVSPIPLQIALPFSHFFLALLSSILLLFLYVGVFFWAIHFLPPPSQRRRMREWRAREPPKKVGGELSQKLLWPFFLSPSLLNFILTSALFSPHFFPLFCTKSRVGKDKSDHSPSSAEGGRVFGRRLAEVPRAEKEDAEGKKNLNKTATRNFFWRPARQRL